MRSRKAWLFVTLAVVCFSAVFLTAPAHAATLTSTSTPQGITTFFAPALVSRNVDAQPLNVSGGGCTRGTYISACIAVGNNVVRPDSYINTIQGCNIYIDLFENGTPIASTYYPNCYPPGSHLLGPTAPAASGQQWQNLSTVWSNGTEESVSSPVQYT